MKVSKFGGTSLANASQIKKVLSIIRSDSDRKYVVVSAPGKRNPQDLKITDLLYEWQRLRELQLSSREVQNIIKVRFVEVIRDLGIEFDLETELSVIEQNINKGASPDYAASRGEYLNGKIIATALTYEFIDPATCIHFDAHGRYVESYDRLQCILQGRKAVIPGFYGSLPDGSIRTFSRGGSDITGAIIASAVGASVYENWTDVSGLLMADPRVVQKPQTIKQVTYRELRELSYMGANVFHEEAMFPVQKAGVTTNIRNTNDPKNDGTFITAEEIQERETSLITGIAGKKDFTVITVEKQMMNQQVGFVRRILTVLEAHGISFEHMPSGIDTLSIIIEGKQLDGKIEKVLGEIRSACSPDKIEYYPKMAMIAVVGIAMAYTPGIAARVFSSLAQKGINIRMINQGSSEISIIVGIENDDYEKAVRAIYGEFVG